MLRTRALAGLFAFLIVVGPSVGEADTTADAAAIEAIWPTYANIVEAGDVDAYLELWTDDGIQMPPNEPPVAGKEHIRARFLAVDEQVTLGYNIDNREVVVSGDIAYSRGVFTGTVTPKDGGESTHLEGKYMTIFRRQPDGTWEIHRDIWNFDVAPGGQ